MSHVVAGLTGASNQSLKQPNAVGRGMSEVSLSLEGGLCEDCQLFHLLSLRVCAQILQSTRDRIRVEVSCQSAWLREHASSMIW